MNHTEAVTEIIKIIPETKEEFKETYKTNSSFMVIGVFSKQNFIKKFQRIENLQLL